MESEYPPQIEVALAVVDGQWLTAHSNRYSARRKGNKMADQIGVKIIDPDGGEKVYTLGRSFLTDGHGDLIVRDADGRYIALRARATVVEVEILE